MPPDPQQALFAQFSRFITNQPINYDDWEAIAAEFGVADILHGTGRFYVSWNCCDSERLRTTRHFLRNVYQEDEDIAFGVMRRVYSSVGGADVEDLQKYPALQVLENGSDKITYPRPLVRSDPFLDIDNVPGTFYPTLIENINSCFQLGVHDATLVLTRKLLENLLIDVLRKKYDTDRMNCTTIRIDHSSRTLHNSSRTSAKCWPILSTTPAN